MPTPELAAAPWGNYTPLGWRKLWIALGRATPLGRGSLRKFWVRHLRRSGPILDLDLGGPLVRVYLGDNRSEIKAAVQAGSFMDEERAALKAAKAVSGRVNVVDIGANAGLFTALALHAANGDGHVLAIEPNPMLLQRLQTNIALNKGNARVDVRAVAVGAETASLDLQFKAKDLGGASLAQTNAAQNNDVAGLETLKVPVESLMGLLTDIGMDTISLLKIDVEGFEDRVLVPFLADAPDMLLPECILMEVAHEYRWQSDLRTAWQERGYQVSTKRGADITLTRQSAS